MNGSYANFPITKSGSVFSMVFDTATIPNGLRSITVVAFDSAGRSNNATVYITVNNAGATPDTTNPVANITAPTVTNVKGTITISANATDPGSNASGVLAVFFDIDGKRLSNPISKSGTSTFSTTYDTKQIIDGDHTLGVTVYDTVLNSTRATFPIKVNNSTPPPPTDTTPPTVNFTSPTSTNVKGIFTISVSAIDSGTIASGVLAVYFDVDGTRLTSPITKSGASTFSTTFDSKTVADGTHTLSVSVYDSALNNKTVSLNVIVDNRDATAPTVSVTSPARNATVLGSVTINATATDNIGVIGVQFKLDNQDIGTEDTTAPYSVSFDSSKFPNGQHTLSATARDAVGLSAISAVTVTFNNPVPDITRPQVNITAPQPGSSVSNTISVSATASDNVGVVGVQFKLDGANQGAEDTTTPYGLSLDTAKLNNASHTLEAIARDAAGNTATSSVSFTVANTKQSYIIDTIAGNGKKGFAGDGGSALLASFDNLSHIAADGLGNFYLADHTNHRIRKIDSFGIITTVAGSGPFGVGNGGFSGDGGSATQARLNGPYKLTADLAGNIYFHDAGNNRIRKITSTGIISTIASVGIAGGDFASILALTTDKVGNLYVTIGQFIVKLDTLGRKTTIAGSTATTAYEGDGHLATETKIFANGLAIDAAGNMYYSENTGAIKKINTNGIVSTVVRLPFTLPNPGYSLAVDERGNLYIHNNTYQVWKVSAIGGASLFAGTGTQGFSGDGGDPRGATLGGIAGIATNASGSVFISDWSTGHVRRVRWVGPPPAQYYIDTVAGNGVKSFSGDLGPATNATMNWPKGITVDALGNFYFVDSSNYRVRKVDTVGTINTVAGNGNFTYSGEGGPAIQASLGSLLEGIAIDDSGNIYITSSPRILKIDRNGMMTRFAGNGTTGSTGDNGSALAASLSPSGGIDVDAAGNVYFSEKDKIRKIDSTGKITTVVKHSSSFPLFNVVDVKIDASGNLYYLDSYLAGSSNGVPLWKRTPSGVITKLAILGKGTGRPFKIAVDSGDIIYVGFADRVEKVDAYGPTHFAGGGAALGDSGLAASASVGAYGGLAMDSLGNLYISDLVSNRIRKVYRK